ncbi:MAG TPA: HEAT repeat domain-containing protein [Pyrinomonadaceae bacterium]|nr:HEAT repeat domain-containing protein [Pyrinomonadaceae bacterium]
MRTLAALSLTLFITSALAQDKSFMVGEIEFYGYSNLHLDRIKAALPLNEGDVIAIRDFPATKEKIMQSVKRELGREATDVSFTCCDHRTNLMIYIGLPGDSSRTFPYNSPARGPSRLSRRILDLYDRAMELTLEAVQKQPDEDSSKGYGLSAYRPLRETELAIREFAIHNELLIRRVLRSSAEPRQRQVAAHALGYARQSRGQISALVRASRDEDNSVRNNAVRALGVLALSSEKLAAWIPAETFVRMLNSGVWEDRNKAGGLLAVLSRGRDPRLVRLLRSEALDSLIEMARWRDPNHASDARMILGRLAGIEEGRLQELVASGNVDEIINAVRR